MSYINLDDRWEEGEVVEINVDDVMVGILINTEIAFF